MERVFYMGKFPLGHWEELHKRLEDLVNTERPARALSDDYLKLTEAVRSDKFALQYVSNLEPARPILDDAYAVQAVAIQVDKFASLLAVLGDGKAAAQYSASAETARQGAELRLQEPPSFLF